MLRSVMIAAALTLTACHSAAQDPVEETAAMTASDQVEWRLVIHGGAGVILRENLTAEREAAYTAALETALEAGADVLRNGGSALDAVQAAVIPMEDDPLFNAGVGAVFTATAEHELDASIMSGAERDAGAVAGVKRVKNPILAARAVMDQSEHVMFAGDGADTFAESVGLEMVENAHFDTESRRQSLERVLREQARNDAERHARTLIKHPAVFPLLRPPGLRGQHAHYNDNVTHAPPSARLLRSIQPPWAVATSCAMVRPSPDPIVLAAFCPR